MYKKILLIMVVVMFPIIVNAETCNKDGLKIESISTIEKSTHIIEKEKPTISDKKGRLNIEMSKPGDSIIYKLIVNNTSNEDYTFDKNSIKINLDYIDYSIETKEGHKVIKSKEKSEIYLKLTYKEEVAKDKYVNGIYKYNEKVTLDLTNKIENPKTKNSLLIIIYLLLIIIITTVAIVTKNNKYKKYIPVLILLIIPFIANAECKQAIEIEANIDIKDTFGKKCTGEIIRDDLNPDEYAIPYILVGNYIYEEVRDSNNIFLGYNVKLEYNNPEYYDVDICSYINDIPVISTRAMFYNKDISKVDLTNFDTRNVTDMWGMFYGVEADILDLSNFDTRNVTNMEFMFSNAKINDLEISTFDTRNVESMGDMFFYYEGNRVKLTNMSNDNNKDLGGFFSNSKINEVILDNFNTESVEEMGGMFSSADIKKIDFSKLNTKNVTNMSNMFDKAKIEKVNLSSFDTSNVENMHSMFRESEIKELDISNFNTSKVTTMNGMFFKTIMEELNLNSFNTKSVKDMDFMFAFSKIKTLDLSTFELDSIEQSNRMFLNAEATTGYAKNQELANFFNSNDRIPTTLSFTVKS